MEKAKTQKKYANPFDEFRSVSRVYNDWDALKDSLRIKFMVAFRLIDRPKPNEYYQDLLKLD